MRSISFSGDDRRRRHQHADSIIVEDSSLFLLSNDEETTASWNRDPMFRRLATTASRSSHKLLKEDQAQGMNEAPTGELSENPPIAPSVTDSKGLREFDLASTLVASNAYPNSVDFWNQ